MSIKVIANFPKKTSRDIIHYPDERLRKMSDKVRVFNQETKNIAAHLIRVIKTVDSPFNFWLGMAAPQIGYHKRIIALKITHNKYRVMVNPELIEKKWYFPALSSCYSIKGLYLIKAYYWCRVQYQDLEGNQHEKIVKGGCAVVLQQEIDHLNGRLLTD